MLARNEVSDGWEKQGGSYIDGVKLRAMGAALLWASVELAAVVLSIYAGI